jgi:hypothetical protein
LWSEAHIVSPFSDTVNDELEAMEACGPFFRHLLEHPRLSTARITVYLRGIDEAGKHAFGDRLALKRVSEHVALQIRAVPPEADRVLHAKLLAVRTDGVWSVLLGSPNATGPAFTNTHANIELGCEFRRIGKSLPTGLLPKNSRVISLEAVLRPHLPKTKARWKCLESATYIPHRKKIVLQWRVGHGLRDSRVLFNDRDLDPSNVDLRLVADRFLKTVPLDPKGGKYEPDFVPIGTPDDEPDPFYDTEPDELTADDWLEHLGSSAAVTKKNTGKRIRSPRGKREEKADKTDPERFEWRERVVMLDQRLHEFKTSIIEARANQEINHLLKTANGVWQSHDPDEPGLSHEVRAWRQWVRAGLWHVLQHNIDRRNRLRRRLSRLPKQWQSAVPKLLREFPVA